jgi:HSP20 family protein
MAIVRWDPFRVFAQIQDRINRVFADAYGGSDPGLMTAGSWVPPVDIYENEDHQLVLKAEIPDMSREDIELTIDNGTLTIKGEKKMSNEVKEDQYHRIERRYGIFSRSFSLPQTVDPGKVDPQYTNRVLTIRLPIRDEAKPRQIKVNVGA